MGKNNMLHNINKRMRILLDDDRDIAGKLLVFDRHMNVVLSDAVETRKETTKMKSQGISATRNLGLIFLRGEHVVSVTMLPDESKTGAAATADFRAAPRSAKAVATKRKRDE